MKATDPITRKEIELFVGVASRYGIGNMGFNPLIGFEKSAMFEVQLATESGQIVPEGIGSILVGVAKDGDAHPCFRESQSVGASSLRFRGYNGGSQSRFVHPALYFLYGALVLCKKPDRWDELLSAKSKRDGNIERIKRMLTSPLSPDVENICVESSNDETRGCSINRLGDDTDGNNYGHARLKFLRDGILARTDTTPLGSKSRERSLDFEDRMVAQGFMSKDWCYMTRPKHELPVKPKDSGDFQSRLLWNAFHILAIAMLGDQERRPLPA